jgi:hypothetical protein
VSKGHAYVTAVDNCRQLVGGLPSLSLVHLPAAEKGRVGVHKGTRIFCSLMPLLFGGVDLLRTCVCTDSNGEAQGDRPRRIRAFREGMDRVSYYVKD